MIHFPAVTADLARRRYQTQNNAFGMCLCIWKKPGILVFRNMKVEVQDLTLVLMSWRWYKARDNGSHVHATAGKASVPNRKDKTRCARESNQENRQLWREKSWDFSFWVVVPCEVWLFGELPLYLTHEFPSLLKLAKVVFIVLKFPDKDRGMWSKPLYLGEELLCNLSS